MSTSQVSIDRKNYKLTTADGDGDSALINDIRRGEGGGEYSASTGCPGVGETEFNIENVPSEIQAQ